MCQNKKQCHGEISIFYSIEDAAISKVTDCLQYLSQMCESIQYVSIDSLDGFTFQNKLMSIMLVMATGQHLHTINTKKC